MQRILSKTHRSGFTIPELLVVLAVLGVLIVLVLSTLGDMYTSSSRTLQNVGQTEDTRNALSKIESSIVLSTGFQTVLTGDPGKTGPAWSYAGSANNVNDRVLIANTYATSVVAANDGLDERLLLQGGAGCDEPVLNSYVFFKDGTNLYRRLVKSPLTPCDDGSGRTNAQLQSCTTVDFAAACGANDALIANNVTRFSVDYFDSQASATPASLQYQTGFDSSTIKTIVVTLGTTYGAGSNATTQTNTIRITRQN